MGESLGIVTKAEGFRDMSVAETTNQKLIEFYEKVYNDIKPINPNSAKDLVVEMIRATNPGASSRLCGTFEYLKQSLKHKVISSYKNPPEKTDFYKQTCYGKQCFYTEQYLSGPINPFRKRSYK